jgi:hypothetical protein
MNFSQSLKFDVLGVNFITNCFKIIALAITLALIVGLYIIIQLSPVKIESDIEIKQGVVSLAGFAFGLSEAGTPGFPNPFNRHDRNKTNYRETNGKHIRNALRGIEENLARNQTLRDYFRSSLNEKQYKGLTEALDKLVKQLRNPNSEMYRDFGKRVSEEIIAILERTRYIE